ncbi:thiamine pyrophosphate-dependent enzyme [Tropicibacter oceani]|uniref:Thiamine pyrophosphate-binding protein n=1 Tax=Tropicibacter oceani TaxID=3058420 RepID=A0ABY8QLA3_9RHOB|nr:thiamine pyrophosphate-dependent enzyme [Tropicibacter oceani]WGW05305.1 thiamine pyrophosphate-binding protein [Tropicibacter oceani]
MTKTTADIMVDALVQNGVDTVFGIPGAHSYELSDALARRSNDIRFIHTRHEQGAAYMAYGYAKSTGRPGVFTVVPGPGVLNAGAAMCTAYGGNAPVMCLTGNIMSHLIGQGRGQLHELPDQLATLKGLTKHADRIDHPGQAADKMATAFTEMLSGRQRPVAVEVPWDVFGQKGVAPQQGPAPRRHIAPDPDANARAAQMIAEAQNPMIMVGGGALDAAAEVLALARQIGAPVASHRSGKGIVSDDDPHAMNLIASYDYFRDCDLLIGIGSRLELQFMRWQWRPAGLKVIRIDIDPTEMVRLKPDLGLVGDAAEISAALSVALDGHQAPDRTAEFQEIKARARKASEQVQPQMGYLDAIRGALPRDGFFVEEVSQMGFTARFGFPVFSPRQYVTCAYQDNLGFGYNTALGVKVANPDKVVVSVSGDGGFMFGMQEMATAMQHGIGVIAVVFNNNAYGNVRRDQMTVFDGRLLGSDLTNPDFVALARSFGMAAERAETPAALAEALDKAIASGGPALIEVPVERGSETSPWTFLHPAPHG